MSESVREAAQAIRAFGLRAEALEHYGTPVTFQMCLSTARQWRLSLEIEEMLRDLREPVFVALG